jgi:hypothetical protein
MTPLEDYILDRMVEAQGLTVTGVADDGMTATYRVTFDVVLDREARAEADREVRANRRTTASVLKRIIKRKLKLFLRDEKVGPGDWA